MKNKYKHVNCHAIEIIEPYINVSENHVDRAWNNINREIEDAKEMHSDFAMIHSCVYESIPWRELRDTLKFLNYSIEIHSGKKFTWFNYKHEDYLYIILK